MKPNEVLLTVRQRGTAIVVTMKTINEEGDITLQPGVPAEGVIAAFKAKYPHANVMVHNLTVQ